jgi:hypothetical protein
VHHQDGGIVEGDPGSFGSTSFRTNIEVDYPSILKYDIYTYTATRASIPIFFTGNLGFDLDVGGNGLEFEACALAFSKEGSDVCQSMPKFPTVGPPTAGILLPSSVLCASVSDWAHSDMVLALVLLTMYLNLS